MLGIIFSLLAPHITRFKVCRVAPFQIEVSRLALLSRLAPRRYLPLLNLSTFTKVLVADDRSPSHTETIPALPLTFRRSFHPILNSLL